MTSQKFSWKPKHCKRNNTVWHKGKGTTIMANMWQKANYLGSKSKNGFFLQAMTWLQHSQCYLYSISLWYILAFISTSEVGSEVDSKLGSKQCSEVGIHQFQLINTNKRRFRGGNTQLKRLEAKRFLSHVTVVFRLYESKLILNKWSHKSTTTKTRMTRLILPDNTLKFVPKVPQL